MPKVTGAGGVQEYTPQEIYDATMSDQWFNYASDESPKINIVSPTGEIISVDFTPENMKQAFDLGWGFESREMEHHGWVKQEYGSKSGELSAALLGGARGLTFGLSDLALTKAGIYTPEELDNWRTANPGISLGSEITGAIVPVVASGGSAAPGTARNMLKQIFSRAPTAQTAKMATKLEQGLAKALKTTSNPNLVTRAIGKGISKGLPVALEGGVYGAGIGLSESVLKDKPFLSEETAAYMGMGALIGGIMGVGLPAAKGLIFGERAPAVIGAYKPFPGVVAPVKKAAVKTYATLSGMISGRDRKLIEKFLTNKAARKTAMEWRKDMPKMLEEIESTGKAIDARTDRVIIEAQEEIGPELLAKDKVFMRAQTEYNKIYSANRSFYDAEMKLAPVPSLYNADTLGAILTGPKRARFLENIEREWIAAEKMIGSLEDTFQRELGRSFPYHKIPEEIFAEPPIRTYLKKATTSAELEVELGMLGKSGKEFVEDALTKKLIPGGVGWFLGGPAGAGLGYALANPSMIAKGLYHIDKSINRIINNRITKALQAIKYRVPAGISIGVRAYDAWHEDEKKKTRKDILQNKQETFQHISSKIKPLADPEILQERLNANLANLQEEFPDIAQDLNITVSRAVSHLMATMPGAMNINAIEALQGKSPYISEVELAKFFRRVIAVEDPLSILDDLAHANISREAVDTVRQVYPRLYAKMVTDIMDALASHKEPVPYATKIQLTYLLGIPMDQTLTPEFIAQAQMNLKPEGAMQGMPPPSGPRGAKVSRMSVANLTKAQSIEGKRTA